MKKVTGLLTTLAIIALTLTQANAATNGWTSHGPYGGTIHALAINQAAPGTIYAGTGNGGGVFRTTNSGATWSAVNTGLGLHGLGYVAALAIDPATPSTLYAALSGSLGDGVFRSTNSGASWTAVLSVVPVLALAIDPTTPSTLYAATYGSGVYKSTNSGGNWSPVNIGLGGTALNLRALAIDPATPSTLYAGTDADGVFKSTNSGASWSATNTGLGNSFVQALAIDPTTPSTVYAGTLGGLYESTNSGSSWVSTGLNSTIYAVVIAPTAPNRIYAGTSTGVARSNTFAGYSAVNNGLDGTTVQALAIHPIVPSTLYAGSAGGGVFLSSTSADNWDAVNNGLINSWIEALAVDPITPSTLYAGVINGGIFKSTNSGGSWSAAYTGQTARNVRVLAIHPITPTTLYAGTFGDGALKSTDSGASWSTANTGMANLLVNALVINPTTPTTLYVGTWGGGVFQSTNSGASWSALNTGLTNLTVWALAINPTTPSTLYAGTDGGIFRSTNSGASWSALNTGLSSPSVYALAIDPITPSTLYAGTLNDGIYKSINSGSSWLATPLFGWVYLLAINPITPSIIYAGYFSSVLRSSNGGASWSEVATSPRGNHALAINPTIPSTVYAGTSGNGVFDIELLHGNEVIDVGEQCDDGNIEGGDGCSASAQIENCYTCTGEPSVCSHQANGAPCNDGDGCPADTCQANVCQPASCPSADAVVLAIRPLTATILSTKTEVAKPLTITVRNADSVDRTIALAVDGSGCPLGMAGAPDFIRTTPSVADTSILVPAGKTKKAKLPLTIRTTDFYSFNFKAPTRCTLIVTASAVIPGGSNDPNPSNNRALVEVNVVNKHNSEQTTFSAHETLVKSTRPTTLTIPANKPSATRTLRAVVVNADYRPFIENPGDAITLTASTTCAGLSLGTPVCDLVAVSNTVTVKGGASKTCRVTATATAAQISTPNLLSPHRCTVTLTASGPTNPQTAPRDGTNNSTDLVIDVLDKNT